MELGKIIKSHRQKQHLGLRELAKIIGVSAATLSRFENGHTVDSDTLKKILLWAL